MSRRRKHIQQFWKAFLEMFRQERLYPWMFSVALVLWASSLTFIIWRIVPLSAEQSFLPLHYNVYFGVDRFGPWFHVFLLPGFGLFFILISLFIQTRFYRREKMLARFFSISTVFLEIGLLVATILIVLLNI